MENFIPFPVMHKTDCSKLLHDLMCIYSVVESNETNLAFIQVQVNVCGVLKKNYKSRHTS